MIEKHCRNCFNARCKSDRVDCVKGWWKHKDYSLDCVVDKRIAFMSELPKKCNDYSPPEQMIFEIYEKSPTNRKRIGRIIDAVKDKRKYWYYDEPPHVKNAYWEEWE